MVGERKALTPLLCLGRPSDRKVLPFEKAPSTVLWAQGLFASALLSMCLSRKFVKHLCCPTRLTPPHTVSYRREAMRGCRKAGV